MTTFRVTPMPGIDPKDIVWEYGNVTADGYVRQDDEGNPFVLLYADADDAEYVRSELDSDPNVNGFMEDEEGGEAEPADEYDPMNGDYSTPDYHLWYQYGKLALTTDPDNWGPQLQEHMDADKFWPSAWYIGERGDENLLSIKHMTYLEYAPKE
jgi:hypothetical protein